MVDKISRLLLSVSSQFPFDPGGIVDSQCSSDSGVAGSHFPFLSGGSVRWLEYVSFVESRYRRSQPVDSRRDESIVGSNFSAGQVTADIFGDDLDLGMLYTGVTVSVTLFVTTILRWFYLDDILQSNINQVGGLEVILCVCFSLMWYCYGDRRYSGRSFALRGFFVSMLLLLRNW
jgi:hypothetical protein